MNAYQRWFLWLTGLMLLLSATQPYAVRAAVTLVSMTAVAESDGTILVEWETATELETSKFVYTGIWQRAVPDRRQDCR